MMVINASLLCYLYCCCVVINSLIQSDSLLVAPVNYCALTTDCSVTDGTAVTSVRCVVAHGFNCTLHILQLCILLTHLFVVLYVVNSYTLIDVNVNVNNRFIQRRVMKHLYCAVCAEW